MTPSALSLAASCYCFNDETFKKIVAYLLGGVASAGFVTGLVDLSGGTNAAPSGQGIADKATLIGRGVNVNTN